MQYIGDDLNRACSEILEKEYNKIHFHEENPQFVIDESIRIEDDNVYVFARSNSSFCHYFLQNIPKCNKLIFWSTPGNRIGANRLANVKVIDIICFQGTPMPSVEYLASFAGLPILVNGIRHNPIYKDIDFTNIYCISPNVDDIPTSVKYLKIDNNEEYLLKLIERLPEFYQLERLTLCKIPTEAELLLLTKMPIKTFWLSEWFAAGINIDYIIKANMFEKINCQRCCFSSEAFENNYVMTRFIVKEKNMDDDKKKLITHIKSILERNKEIIKLSQRFHSTKSARNTTK